MKLEEKCKGKAIFFCSYPLMYIKAGKNYNADEIFFVMTVDR